MVFSMLPRQWDCVSLDNSWYMLLTGLPITRPNVGIHLGDSQTANLGDGNGNVVQAIEAGSVLIRFQNEPATTVARVYVEQLLPGMIRRPAVHCHHLIIHTLTQR